MMQYSMWVAELKLANKFHNANIPDSTIRELEEKREEYTRLLVKLQPAIKIIHFLKIKRYSSRLL